MMVVNLRNSPLPSPHRRQKTNKEYRVSEGDKHMAGNIARQGGECRRGGATLPYQVVKEGRPLTEVALGREKLGDGWHSGGGLTQARGAASERLPDKSLVE